MKHLLPEWKMLLAFMIKHARHMNEHGKKSISQTMYGTEYLHDMLKDRVIDNALYQKLKRLAEDSRIEYEIIIG